MSSTEAANPIGEWQEYEQGNVKRKILVAGSGARPTPGSEVEVHYVGTLLDGTKFDSSRDRNETFKFKLGAGQVIKGWDKGVAMMKIGEKSMFELSPEYAYGASGSPPKIPPNSSLLLFVCTFIFPLPS